VRLRDYGEIRSVRGGLAAGAELAEWSLVRCTPPLERTSRDRVWPRPDERGGQRRRAIPAAVPMDASGLWVARAEALPDAARPAEGQLVWVSGRHSWHRLAARGVWVHGSSEGLGDLEDPDIERLAGRRVEWVRLTHAGSDAPNALATYIAESAIPADLAARTHFFWTSGSLFRRALDAHPSIRDGWHGSGPGRTARVLRDVLGPGPRVSIWLDYDQWLQHVIR
jgi:hydroxymethylbilane synthase